MGSIDERLEHMPRIKIDFSESFVVEINNNGIKMAEIICFIEALSYNTKDGSSEVKFSVYNPHAKGFNGVTTSDILEI